MITDLKTRKKPSLAILNSHPFQIFLIFFANYQIGNSTGLYLQINHDNISTQIEKVADNVVVATVFKAVHTRASSLR